MTRIITRMMLACMAAVLAPGCAFLSPATTVDVSYKMPDGVQIEAHYRSTKDIGEPEFTFERDPASGRVNAIRLSAGSSTASSVIESNAAFMQAFGAAAGEAVGRAAGAAARGAVAPQSLLRQPASVQQVEQLLWEQ